ncbi:MAG TPA: thioredoxin [Firmicutes bacterium]|nr:thioredoxin [Bacillota bacterium]
MATVNLTGENFNETIGQGGIVLVEFFAPWCPHCKSFTPVFEAASEKHPDIVFGLVDTSEQQELAQHYNIRGVPTVAAFRDGLGVYQQPGALTAEQIEALIEKVSELNMDDVRRELENQKSDE